MDLTAIIEDDEGYFAWCPQLRGCHTQGDTLAEAQENIHEAIALYLESMDPEEIQALSAGDSSYDVHHLPDPGRRHRPGGDPRHPGGAGGHRRPH